VGESNLLAGHAFISYVREDSRRVDQLQQMLQAAGIPVWRDTADLWPGEDWRAKIRRAITDNALVFIACFSHASLARGRSYQNEELTLAIEQLRLRPPDHPWLIPVRLDDCEIPDRDIGGGRMLTSIQCADLFGERSSKGAARLIEAVKRILGSRMPAPPTAVEADSGLADFVMDFARGIEAVDSRAPVASSARTGAPYQPGIGPQPEAQTIKLVMTHLAKAEPPRYSSYGLGVPYADSTRQTCDVCLGGPAPWEWAIEVKMLRLMGDNGHLNDNMVMHILSQHPQHRSALTECTKLVASHLGIHKAIVIYGYDYPSWPMDPTIEAFETLASQRVKIVSKAVASFDGLIHPVHQRGRVFGWQVEPLDDLGQAKL
jgi:hypothetical protein